MLQQLFEVRRVRILDTARVYPSGVDWVCRQGINVVIGGTGLGKTTLLNAALFGLFGPLGRTLPGGALTHEYFQGRLFDRRKTAEDRTSGRVPRVITTAAVGTSTLEAERDLRSGELISCSLDGESLRINSYPSTFARLLGVSNFADHVVRIVDHLLYVSDQHYLLAWDPPAQNQVLGLLFAETRQSDKLLAQWDAATSADSLYRNLRVHVNKLDAQVREQEQQGVGDDVVAAQRTALEMAVATAASRRDSLVARLDELTANLARLDLVVATAQRDFEEAASNLSEVAPDQDEELRAIGITAPDALSSYWAIQRLVSSPRDTVCCCCSRRPTHVTSVLTSIRDAILADECPLCGIALAGETRTLNVEQTAQLESIANARFVELRSALVQRAGLHSQATLVERDSLDASGAFQRARDELYKFTLANPSAGGGQLEQRRAALLSLTQEMAEAEALRDRALSQFGKAEEKLRERLNSLTLRLVEHFRTYAELFLDTTCSVELDLGEASSRRPGHQVKAPHATFYPVVDGIPRYRAGDLSEAQRLFVDLALRLAILHLWNEETSGVATLCIETPEGTVDVAYMSRVAEMIALFAKQGHTVIVTTNLHNQEFLTDLLSETPRRQRRNRILNTFDIGTPRPIQEARHGWFNSVIEDAVNGP